MSSLKRLSMRAAPFLPGWIGILTGVMSCMLVFIGATTAMAADHPHVTTQSLDADGVLLLSADSSEAGAYLTAVTITAERQALLPYAVVLKNATPRDIVAYCVVWTLTGVNGTVRTQTLTRRNFTTFQGGDAIEAGGAKLLSFAGDFRRDAASLGERQIADMQRAIRSYADQQAVLISLELVVFNDGTAVGPDRQAALPKLSAWLDAERDLSREALQEGNPHKLVVRARAIRDQAFDTLPPISERTSGMLMAAAEVAKGYARTYELAKAYFAAQVTAWAEEANEDVARRNLSSLTGRKLYPVIHRKGERQ
jgi:hypothetical protein